MEAISPSFDDFDFAVDPFQSAGMDGVIAMVDNPIVVSLEHSGKLGQLSMFQTVSQGTPLIDPFVSPTPGSVGPDVLELVSEDQHCVDHLVELQELFEVLALCSLPDFGSEQQVRGSFEHLLVLFGSLTIFTVANLIDEAVELGNHMKQIEDDFHMGDLLSYGFDIGVPHIHGDGLKSLSLLRGHVVEKGGERFGSSVLPNPHYSSALIVERHGQVPMSNSRCSATSLTVLSLHTSCM